MKYMLKGSREVVKAFKYEGDFIGRDGQLIVPKWAMKALNSGKLYYKDQGDLMLYGRIQPIPVGSYILKRPDYFIMVMDPETFEEACDPIRKNECGGV